jgi:hypothetical protein
LGRERTGDGKLPKLRTISKNAQSPSRPVHAVLGASPQIDCAVQTGDLINIMAKGKAIGMYRKLRIALSRSGTFSILLRPILPMITAQRLITK